MVGYNPKGTKLTYRDVAFAGAASGFITRALCQPLDVLKIRFQLQVEPIAKHANSKYHSIPQAILTIAQEEGVKSFWKGHVPAQWLSVIYGLGQFWFFAVSSKISYDLGFSVRYNSLSNFFCGSLAGTFATVVSFPFDVIRTRLVAQNELQKVYTGVTSTFFSIAKNEGFFVLYRGLFPTLIQIAPHAGVQFMTYEIFASIYQNLIPKTNDENKISDILSSSVLCGSLAGLCAKTAIYPLDLSKKRMQVQGFDRKMFGENFLCNGLIDCMKRIYGHEGILGFYKGLGPSLIKAVVTTALHFSSYEIICLEISKRR